MGGVVGTFTKAGAGLTVADHPRLSPTLTSVTLLNVAAGTCR